MPYGAGLRASEVISLKVAEVDSQRMTLRVEQGKGRKNRYAMLSPVLLQRLRSWWRIANAQGRMLPGCWLFPGLDPTDRLTARQLNRAVHAVAEAAGRAAVMKEQDVPIPPVAPDIGPVETCAKCLGPVDMSDWHLTFTEGQLEETDTGIETREFRYVAVVCKTCAPRKGAVKRSVATDGNAVREVLTFDASASVTVD